jgi:hypothetical protein
MWIRVNYDAVEISKTPLRLFTSDGEDGETIDKGSGCHGHDVGRPQVTKNGWLTVSW